MMIIIFIVVDVVPLCLDPRILKMESSQGQAACREQCPDPLQMSLDCLALFIRDHCPSGMTKPEFVAEMEKHIPQCDVRRIKSFYFVTLNYSAKCDPIQY